MVYIAEDMDEKDKLFPTCSFSKDTVFAPCSFSSLGLDSILCEQLQGRLGFQFPTIVQARAIPIILSGRHVLVNASTGTGKTMAYLAPVINQLQSYETRITRSDGTFVLVLVPRRELCLQIFETLQKLLHRFHWIVPGYVMGGENRLKEKSRLRKGISILVATPGRLLDHLSNTCSFIRDKLRWIIFDEADSILELGFRKEIEEILHILGARRDSEKPEGAHCKAQMLLLSATLNNQVNDLANISLDHPVTIGLSENQMSENPSMASVLNQRPESLRNGPSHEKYNVPVQLVQKYIQVCCGSRLVVLLSILKNFSEREGCEKTVVFFSTCNSVNFHHSLFNGLRLGGGVDGGRGLFLKSKILRLHGDMEQGDRTATFQAFKAENSAILLCTDVAARGLDFPRVKCIVQYDSPGEATEYVHRVGRTARLGESGTSLLFLQPVEMGYLEELKKHGVFPTEYESGHALANSGTKPAYGFVASTPVSESYPLPGPLERAMRSLVEKEVEVKKQAKSAFRSWVRAYTAHRGELKRIFVVKKLHLGHVARSFVLKKEPSLGGGLSKKRRTMIVKKRKR